MRPMTQAERGQVEKILNEGHEFAVGELDAADPGWRKRVEDRKNKVALGRLRVEKDVVEQKKIESQIRLLQEKLQAIELRIQQKMPMSERTHRGGCPLPKSFCDAVAEITSEVHEKVMAADPTGKKVLALRMKFLATKVQLAKCTTREDLITYGVLPK